MTSYFIFWLLAIWWTSEPFVSVPPMSAAFVVVWGPYIVWLLCSAERREHKATAALTKAQEDIAELEETPLVFEDWQIRDLAEAHQALHVAGLRDARDRLERVLEDIQPDWRLYA